MSQNQKLSEDDGPLDPLWVRCDMSDLADTSWLGAETVHLANKVTGVKLYSVTCKGILGSFSFLYLQSKINALAVVFVSIKPLLIYQTVLC